MKSRIIWLVGSLVALCVCWVICRALSWSIFINTQWSTVLFIFGLVILIIAAIIDGRKIMLCIVIGYVISFITGILFNSDSPDPTGAMVYNNWWQIWTYVYLIFIGVGVVLEIITKIVSKKGIKK